MLLDPSALRSSGRECSRHGHRGWCALVAGIVLVHAVGCARPADSLLLTLSSTKMSADGTMFWMSAEHDAAALSVGEARLLAANPIAPARSVKRPANTGDRTVAATISHAARAAVTWTAMLTKRYPAGVVPPKR